MPVTDSYCTLQDFNALYYQDTPNLNAVVVTRALLQATRMVDRYCGRFFGKDASPVARTFRVRAATPSRNLVAFSSGSGPIGWAESENPYLYGGWSRVLDVDDLAATPTEIVIDQNGDGSFSGETPLASTHYELWPTVAPNGPESKPWQQIYLPPTSSVGGFRTNGLVRVTAQWGWPAVPEPINWATSQIAVGILAATGASSGPDSPSQLYKRIAVDGQTLEYRDVAAVGQIPDAVKAVLNGYARSVLG